MKPSKPWRARSSRRPHGSPQPAYRLESTRDEAASAWRDLGREALLGGDVAEALWYLRGALEADSDSSATWRLLARCFEEMGEQVRSRRCHTVALRLSLSAGSSVESISATSLLNLDWDLHDTHET